LVKIRTKRRGRDRKLKKRNLGNKEKNQKGKGKSRKIPSARQKAESLKVFHYPQKTISQYKKARGKRNGTMRQKRRNASHRQPSNAISREG